MTLDSDGTIAEKIIAGFFSANLLMEHNLLKQLSVLPRIREDSVTAKCYSPYSPRNSHPKIRDPQKHDALLS